MSTVRSRPKPELSTFEQNRQRFTDEQLMPFQGKWVGFSMDGRRIVASGATLVELNSEVERAGEAISNVALEFIDLDDAICIESSETI